MAKTAKAASVQIKRLLVVKEGMIEYKDSCARVKWKVCAEDVGEGQGMMET